MHISNEIDGTGTTMGVLHSEIDALQCEVEMLENTYGELLEQESLTQEVAALRQSIEQTLQGSQEAAAYLREHGMVMLNDIKERLKAAAADQARMIEESPTVAQTASGESVDKATKAATLAADAETHLKPALDEASI